MKISINSNIYIYKQVNRVVNIFYYFIFIIGAVELIYNLTIEKTLEEKVVRKGILKLLCLLLDRTSTDLLLISLKLLIQLSVYKENIDKMVCYCIFFIIYILNYIFKICNLKI